MKYRLILTDNPWGYSDTQGNDPARGGITYPTLSEKELHDLPVSNIADDNCLLVSWCTMPMICDGYPLSIIRAWGFRPVTTLFVWVKTNKNGAAINDDTDLLEYEDYYSGLGRYTNSNVEFAIVARKGKMLERLDKSVKQLIFAPIGKHSEKPQEQYNRLFRLFGDVPRIELFARKQNAAPLGWKMTGLDYDGKDIRDFLKEHA